LLYSGMRPMQRTHLSFLAALQHVGRTQVRSLIRRRERGSPCRINLDPLLQSLRWANQEARWLLAARFRRAVRRGFFFVVLMRRMPSSRLLPGAQY
jgi:hypothetical protein